MLDELRFWLIGRRRAQTLSESDYHDIFALERLGVITLAARGQSIMDITVDVASRSDRTLKILIPIATFFTAKGAHQNMVSTREVVLRIGPRGKKLVTISVVCVNADRPIPGKDDSFGRLRQASDDVSRFIKSASVESPMAIQAGVWALTDGLDRIQLKHRLVREGGSSHQRYSITDHDIDCARAILVKLNLKTNIS